MSNKVMKDDTGQAINTTLQSLVGAISPSDLLLLKQYTCEYNISANASLNISANDLSISTPSGYTPISVYLISTGNSNILMRNLVVSSTGTQTFIAVKNTSANTISDVTLLVGVVYAKSNVVTIV